MMVGSSTCLISISTSMHLVNLQKEFLLTIKRTVMR